MSKICENALTFHETDCYEKQDKNVIATVTLSGIDI